ncbi:MAG TPA: response regulator [Pyrinomonadaceae bacterium]|jgi:CheY-like chemotaxis protein
MQIVDGHNRRVLLVEDFADTRYMMRQLLEMSGYTVIEATDGREAVECAEKECPDLILMDLSLPEVDGISATRTIRKLEKLSDVPIIALTAHDTEDFYTAARAAGCNEYVTKPVDFDRLDMLIGDFCPAM